MTDQASLVHHLDRSLVIKARRDTVFRFFTDPMRWAAWWGDGSTIEPRPQGLMRIRYPDGTEAVGEVVEVTPPERLVFTYGYAKGTPVPPGGSLVTIILEEHRDGTELRLTHAFAEPSVRDQHLQGWRYQLSLFANVVTNEVHGGAADAIDRWFTAWSEPDDSVREAAVRQIASSDVCMRDRFSAIAGLDDLLAQLAAVRRFMPGIQLRRHGDVRQCQGLALADWVMVTSAGEQRGGGTNVFELAADGRIVSVTGFWAAPSAR